MEHDTNNSDMIYKQKNVHVYEPTLIHHHHSWIEIVAAVVSEVEIIYNIL